MAEFVHLHLHTEFSLLDGACRIDELLDQAVKLKMPAIAVTEHGNMFSSVIFHDHARARGLNPILGCEVYVAPGDRQDRSGVPGATQNHLVLLAENLEGYHNLIKLVSAGYTEGFYYKPRIDKALLAQHSKGLIGLSSCLKGEVAEGLSHQQDRKAIEAAAAYRDILGPNNFFLEMQWHGIEEQRLVNSGLPAIAKDLGLPMICTNDVHYLQAADAHPHDILLCIGTGKAFSDPKRLRYDAKQFFLKTAEEMADVFKDHPDAIANTMRIAERCDVKIAEGENFLPDFDVPIGFTVDSYFDHVAREGFAQRLPRLQQLAASGALRHTVDEYERRLSYELDMIKKMKYPGYFLIVWDFIRYAREQGIPVGPGRGSAAGSLVAYCMRITDVDPIDFDLIFERFLNPERVSMPDIDIDFDDLRRGEVIQYVKDKYGEGNVTQIITFGTMGAKGVVRDVGRALGFPVAEVDRMAKLVPDGLGMTLDKALDLSPDLKALPAKSPQHAKLLKAARVLEGLARHASTHAAGVLITPGPLLDYVPLYRQKDGTVTTQWDMKSVEKAGLLKMDFLGLRTLSVLDEGLRLVQRHHGVAIDWETLDFADPRAYKVFQDGDTVAIFQFESGGMRDYLRRLKPTVFGDLTAMNALYRPGPMENIPYFVDCKHGRQVAKYDHAKLEPILKSTYGVFVYQEQVMAAAHDLAGFSMSQADELRRAMGKKNVDEMAKKREQFIEGCGKTSKIPAKIAEKIFTTMEKFAGYGFNRSHSAAYAMVAYQCAYLKAHYPAEFMAATMSSEMSDSARLLTLLEETRRMKIAVLPPDVNRSEWKFTIEEGQVRLGLGAVRNVGQGAVEALLAARAEGGPFASIHDLATRLSAGAFNRRQLESLVGAGACDSLGAAREAMHAGAAMALDHAASLHREKASGQSSLFGGDEGTAMAVSAPPLPAVPGWSNHERSAKEKESLGFYFSDHPLAHLREEIERIATHPIAMALEAGDGADVRVVGIVADVKQVTTRAGKLMARVILEDLSGRVECTVFPEAYEQARGLLQVDSILVAAGRIEVREERGASLLLSEVKPWEQGREQFRPVLQIEVRAEELTEERVLAIDEVLCAHPGESEVYLYIVKPDHSRLAMRARKCRVAQSDGLIAGLKERVPSCRVRWGKGAA